jgi:hypothetical protein
MSRATCQHSVLVPKDGSPIWKPRSANGPMVATCERCGKVMKYSRFSARFARAPVGHTDTTTASLAMFVAAQLSMRRGRR